MAFHITVRDASGVIAQFAAISATAGQAEDIARQQYDQPVGISVRPA